MKHKIIGWNVAALLRGYIPPDLHPCLQERVMHAFDKDGVKKEGQCPGATPGPSLRKCALTVNPKTRHNF